MKALTHKKRIIERMTALEVYKPEFEATITALATLLRDYDETDARYDSLGRPPLYKHTNKGGAANFIKHPLLAVLEKQREMILKYYSELGLTPRGFLKLKPKGLHDVRKSTLENFLANEQRE